MKKFLLIIVSVMMLITAVGCGQTKTDTKKTVNPVKRDQKIVGVLMPHRESPRWIKDGNNLRYEFEKRGYKVDLQSSDNDVERQRSQLKYMIDNGADAIIITPIDSGALSDVLVGAKEKNIPVIAYDRLVMNSDAVSFYVSFDNKAVGRLFGEYIENTFALNSGAGFCNAEIFSGSASDSNAEVIYEGLLEVLQPYIDNGQIRIPSGQIAFEETATYLWRKEEAQKRMTNLLNSVYGNGTRLDAVICSSDVIANGIVNVLNNSSLRPIITGQDGDLYSIQYIVAGKQAMTVFKDSRLLADKCAHVVESIFNGTLPEVTDNMTYNNGEMIVPSYLCEPILITKDNIKEHLLDTGYYAPEEVGLSE
ncbi:MAG: sugar-binding protein [Selenomonadaceae bacterium]|nr:sugar-binding protein [Selenomonadaceae bacterium]